MSVFNRRMFNRGGYVHRGTGITSGLVPVQQFQEGGLSKKERADIYRPAWMSLFGNMMTGKSFQGGFGGAMDILGQATQQSAPLFAQAAQAAQAAKKSKGNYFWAWNTKKNRYDRVTDEIIEASEPGTYIKEEPSEDDAPTSWQEYIRTVPEGQEGTAEGYAEFLEGGTTASIPTSWNEYVLQVPAGTKPTPTGYGQFLDRNKYKVPKEFITYLLTVPKDQEPTPDGFKEFLDRNTGTDTDETWKKEPVILTSKTDLEAEPIEAFRYFDQESRKTEYRDKYDKIIENLEDYNISEKEKDDEGETSKPLRVGWYTNKKGEKVDAEFIQDGNDVYWLNDAGKAIPLEQAIETNEWQDYNIETGVPKYVKSIDDIKTELEETQDIQAKYDLIQPVLQKYVDDAQINRSRVNQVNELMMFIGDSTAGSYAEQRNAFLRLLDTFEFDKMAPDTYGDIQELLKAGQIPGTELVNAMFKASVLQDALGWSQQLNKSELGLLFEKGPQIYLTKPGQELLALGTKADAEWKVEAARMIREGIKDGKKLTEIFSDVEDFMDESAKNFLEQPEIAAAIKKVQDYGTLGDLDFFTDMKTYELTNGVTIDTKSAYKDGRIIFGGYATEDGEWIGPNGQTYTDLLPSKPVYFVDPSEEEWGDAPGKRQVAVTQFDKAL